MLVTSRTLRQGLISTVPRGSAQEISRGHQVLRGEEDIFQTNCENHGTTLIPNDGLLVPPKKTDLKFELITWFRAEIRSSKINRPSVCCPNGVAQEDLSQSNPRWQAWLVQWVQCRIRDWLVHGSPSAAVVTNDDEPWRTLVKYDEILWHKSCHASTEFNWSWNQIPWTTTLSQLILKPAHFMPWPRSQHWIGHQTRSKGVFLVLQEVSNLLVMIGLFNSSSFFGWDLALTKYNMYYVRSIFFNCIRLPCISMYTLETFSQLFMYIHICIYTWYII